MWEKRLFYYIRRLVDDEHAAWQILQETPSSLRVTVTMPGGRATGDVEAIRTEILALVDDEVSVAVEVVGELRRTSPAKLRSVISMLPEARTPG